MAPTKRTAFITTDYVKALQPPTDKAQEIVWDSRLDGDPAMAEISVLSHCRRHL